MDTRKVWPVKCTLYVAANSRRQAWEQAGRTIQQRLHDAGHVDSVSQVPEGAMDAPGEYPLVVNPRRSL